MKAAIVLTVLAASAAAVVPSLTGRPVVSYASSESMEPTIGVLDAFLVNPFPGALRVGDIVVFHSISQGGPAVHRIVGEAEGGWYTQGDANAGVDQAAGEPVLTRERVLGKVVTTREGAPIVLDDMGAVFLELRADAARAEAALGGERQVLAALFLAAAAVLAIPAFLVKGRRAPQRRMRPATTRLLRRLLPRGILGRHVGLAALGVALAALALLALNASHDVTTSLVVVADRTAADPYRATYPGGSLERTIEVASLGIVPSVVILEPGSASLATPDDPLLLGPRSTARVEVTQTARERTGLQEDALHVWRYPAILPRDAVLALHQALPGSPYVVLGAFVAAGGALWFSLLGIGRMPVGRVLGVREEWL